MISLFLRPIGSTGKVRNVVWATMDHHPCDAPYGYVMCRLNIMQRSIPKWRFKNHANHD